jgi:ATP-binding cassette, subfamily B (MDR/TAP), member 1
MPFLSDRESNRLTASSQIRELQLGTSQPMGFAVEMLVECFVALGIAFSYGWKLTLVILASVPILAAVLHLISRHLQDHITAQGQALAGASSIAHSSISNIVLLKCFNTQSQETRQYTTHIQNAAAFYLRQARTVASQFGFINFATTTMFVQGPCNKDDLGFCHTYRV